VAWEKGADFTKVDRERELGRTGSLDRPVSRDDKGAPEYTDESLLTRDYEQACMGTTIVRDIGSRTRSGLNAIQHVASAAPYECAQ